MELIDSNAYLVALHRAEWAITALACVALAGAVWSLLSLRLYLLRKPLNPLVATGLTTVGVLASFLAVAYLFLLAFDPFAQVPIWCQPPAPHFGYILAATVPAVAIAHALVHRSHGPA